MNIFKKIFSKAVKECRELQLNGVYKHKNNQNKPMRLVIKALDCGSYQYIRVNSNTGRQNKNHKVGNTNFLLDNYICIEKI